MTSFLAREPDAVALLLLLVLLGGALLAALLFARAADRARVRPARGPGEPPEERALVSTWPHLLRLELLAALAALLLVTWWALLVDLPIPGPADPRTTPRLAKAPWFFLGVQEMLHSFDAWLGAGVLPLVMIVGLAALPYLDRRRETGYSLRDPVPLLVTALLLLLWIAPALVGLFGRGEGWVLEAPWSPPRPDEPVAPAPLELADLLGVPPPLGRALGAVLAFGPFAALLGAWPLLRRRRAAWAARVGLGRYLVSGALLVSMAGLLLKVFLRVVLDLRYLLVTPWFRI
jgi:hypothetical protein